MTNIYDTKDSTLHEDDMQSSCLFLVGGAYVADRNM